MTREIFLQTITRNMGVKYQNHCKKSIKTNIFCKKTSEIANMKNVWKANEILRNCKQKFNFQKIIVNKY